MRILQFSILSLKLKRRYILKEEEKKLPSLGPCIYFNCTGGIFNSLFKTKEEIHSKRRGKKAPKAPEFGTLYIILIVPVGAAILDRQRWFPCLLQESRLNYSRDS